MTNDRKTRKVVVWGLPGSGKTTFLLAFLKSMRLFGPDMGWHFSLQSSRDQANDLFQKSILANFIENHKLPPQTKVPTNIPVDLYYQRPKGNLAFDHSLEILDAPGESIYGDERYLNKFIDLDALICVLDHSDSTQSYLKALPVLQDYLQANNHSHRLKVAFCLSRADQYINFASINTLMKESQREQQRSFRQNIASVIGKDVLVSIEQVLSESQMRYFLTSAIGWTRAKNGDYFPNCTAVTGQSSLFIYKPSFWQPQGILEIFFWLLDELDLKVQDPEMENLRYEQMIRLYWKWYNETKRTENFHRWIEK